MNEEKRREEKRRTGSHGTVSVPWAFEEKPLR